MEWVAAFHTKRTQDSSYQKTRTISTKLGSLRDFLDG